MIHCFVLWITYSLPLKPRKPGRAEGCQRTKICYRLGVEIRYHLCSLRCPQACLTSAVHPRCKVYALTYTPHVLDQCDTTLLLNFWEGEGIFQRSKETLLRGQPRTGFKIQFSRKMNQCRMRFLKRGLIPRQAEFRWPWIITAVEFLFHMAGATGLLFWARTIILQLV